MTNRTGTHGTGNFRSLRIVHVVICPIVCQCCLLSTYHRMAGGVGMKISARPKLSSRLANRVLHKFTYSPQQYDLLGCVGCGRCIDACLGAIDIRQVVEELGQ